MRCQFCDCTVWIGGNQHVGAMDPKPKDWNNGNKIRFVQENENVILFHRLGRIMSVLNFANMVVTINATEVNEQATMMHKMIILVKGHFKDHERIDMLVKAVSSLRGHAKDLIHNCSADAMKRSVA